MHMDINQTRRNQLLHCIKNLIRRAQILPDGGHLPIAQKQICFAFQLLRRVQNRAVGDKEG